MTELSSFSSFANKKIEFSASNYLFSNLSNFCFFIFSDPLYLSYCLFFSPYLYKLLSFLSPLFITTTLLLLVAILTFTPNLVHEKGGSEIPESKLDFILSVFQTSVSWLLSKAGEHKDEDTGWLSEFEAYLVMFQASIFEVLEPKSVEGEDSAESYKKASAHADLFGSTEDSVVTSEENRVEKVDTMEEEATVPIIAEVKSLETLFQENNAELEDMCCEKKEKEVKPMGPESNKVDESEGKWPLRSGSKVMSGNRDKYAKKVKGNINGGEYATAMKVKSQSQRLESNLGSPENTWEYCGKVVMGNNQTLGSNLVSFGSMRVEKEWRRTLACKLFEERHNADGIEGMDMLWETYETESDKSLKKKKSNTKKGKEAEVEHNDDVFDDGDDEDEEDEEKEMEGKLCCLQALKFSAGKMNFGMGRPNLVKFSKALKGFGWMHHVSKHGKKGKPPPI